MSPVIPVGSWMMAATSKVRPATSVDPSRIGEPTSRCHVSAMPVVTATRSPPTLARFPAVAGIETSRA